MKINKAVITAAGKKQRTLPLQTLIDRDGSQKSVLKILIEEVLQAAARIKKQPPKMSRREIAQHLVDEDRAAGYKFETVRKILYGTFQAQIDRDIPGLTVWMRQDR